MERWKGSWMAQKRRRGVYRRMGRGVDGEAGRWVGCGMGRMVRRLTGRGPNPAADRTVWVAGCAGG